MKHKKHQKEQSSNELNSTKPVNPEKWLDRYGDYLYCYTIFRIDDPMMAEDLVQECLLAGLQSQHAFKGESSEKIWLLGILKHKIIDHYRKEKRESPISDLATSEDTTEDFFDKKGKWKIKPKEWVSDPSTIFEQKEIWTFIEGCLANLSIRLRYPFWLLEIDGLGSKEICKVLDIKETNLWVLLHRARFKLRFCLEQIGFGKDSIGE